MKPIDRVILAVYAVLSLAALIAVCVCLMIPGMSIGPDVALWMRPVAWAAMLGLVAWCARLVMLKLRPGEDETSESAMVRADEAGDVRVSIQALEALARSAIAQSAEILDSRLKIGADESGVSVEIEMAVSGDARVPELTAALQSRIRKAVEECAGLEVRSVKALVSEIREAAPEAAEAPKTEPERETAQ